MVSFHKELPDERLQLEVEYLLDSISSASIASGSATLGGDKVFTELRHEASLRQSSKIQAWNFGTFLRYSTETDYEAFNFGASFGREFLQKTVNLGLSYSASLDRAFRIVNALGVRVPWTSSGDSNLVQSHYLALGYGHVLTPHLVLGANLEGIYTAGPQDNPYRRARDGQNERHPLERKRIAPSAWLRVSIPAAKMVIEPRYRYYTDDWKVRAHTIDGRFHFRVADHWRVRLRYRYYTQSESYFWRDDGAYEATGLASDDPKMDDFRSHTPGLGLAWEMDGIAHNTGAKWLEGSYIQANFNYAFVRCKDLSASCSDRDLGYDTIRTTRYGDARLGSLTFSLAF